MLRAQRLPGVSFALAAFVLTSFALSGCAGGIGVEVAYDPSAKFPVYRSFAMAYPNKPVRTDPKADPFLHQRLRQFVFERLAQQGLVPTKKQEADLLVYVGTTSRERVDVYQNYYSSGPYFGGPYVARSAWGAGYSRPVVVEEGILTIDLVDRKENSVLWRGTGDLGSVASYKDDDWRRAVVQILSRYPPQGRK